MTFNHTHEVEGFEAYADERPILVDAAVELDCDADGEGVEFSVGTVRLGDVFDEEGDTFTPTEEHLAEITAHLKAALPKDEHLTQTLEEIAIDNGHRFGTHVSLYC